MKKDKDPTTSKTYLDVIKDFDDILKDTQSLDGRIKVEYSDMRNDIIIAFLADLHDSLTWYNISGNKTAIKIFIESLKK